jgi:hypothetical protein
MHRQHDASMRRIANMLRWSAEFRIRPYCCPGARVVSTAGYVKGYQMPAEHGRCSALRRQASDKPCMGLSLSRAGCGCRRHSVSTFRCRQSVHGPLLIDRHESGGSGA